jgi:hypothetical protein
MKYTLVLVPIILLVVLNACGTNPNDGGGGGEDIPSDVFYRVVATQTAMSWTLTPPPPTPDIQTIMYYLNLPPSDEFVVRLDDLEDTIGAGWKFLNVEFPPDKNNLMSVFQVDVRCQCAGNGQCCSRERGFIFTVLKMKPYISSINQYVPLTVKYMNVVTYNHENQFQGMSADWEDVKNFLTSSMNGSSFGFQVTPVPPAP